MAIINKVFNCEVCEKPRLFKYSENLKKVYGYSPKCKSCNMIQYNKKFNNSKRKYEIKDNFIQIDTSDKAYIFGFLWADGHLSTIARKEHKLYSVRCILNSKDRDVLEFIQSIIGGVIFDSSVFDKRTKKSYKRSTWIMNSKEVVMNFQNLNFRKNLDSVPIEFYTCFLRGLIDGDGTFGYYDKDIKIKITSSYEDNFEYLLHVELIKKLFTIRKNISKNGKSTSLIFHGSNDQKINLLVEIYKDGFSMLRKKQKLNKIIYEYNDRPIKYKLKLRTV